MNLVSLAMFLISWYASVGSFARIQPPADLTDEKFVVAETVLPAPPEEPPVLDCAVTGMARIAAHENMVITRRHWSIARSIADAADTCDEAFILLAVSRQESTWRTNSISSAGACGITQVRSCDAEGTWDDMPCCNGYSPGCRPTCEWLLVPENAISWTIGRIRERGWDPGAYLGSQSASANERYTNRQVRWYNIASGNAPESD